MVYRSCSLLDVSADTASILVTRPASCEACAKGQGCGLAIFRNHSAEPGPVSIRVCEGDGLPVPPCAMQVGISEGRLMFLSALAYGLPVLAMLFGAWIAPALFSPAAGDWIGFGGALAGLGAAVLVLRRFDRNLRCRLSHGPGEIVLRERSSS
ncbi:MAG: SoxR reducing system RseC family protein [Gammaproteobacteria bacterium]